MRGWDRRHILPLLPGTTEEPVSRVRAGQAAQGCKPVVVVAPLRAAVASVLLGLLQLGQVLLVGGVVSTPLPVVGGPDSVIPAPVPLAQDPGQHVHLVVQLRGELGADEVGDTGALAAGDEASVLIVAAVLGSQGGAVEGQHGAQAEASRGFVDVQALLGAAGVPPSEALALLLIPQVDSAVHGLQGVRAGTAGQVRQNLAQVLGQEIALAVQPLLTAVHLCGEGSRRVRACTFCTPLHPAAICLKPCQHHQGSLQPPSRSSQALGMSWSQAPSPR